MNTSAALLLLALAAPVEVGTQLTYRGAMAAEKGELATTLKTFQLTLLVTDSKQDEVSYLWSLDEQGQGGWSWLYQFGTTRVKAGEASVALPTLLYQREEGNSPVPVLAPFVLPPEPLKAGLTWKEGEIVFNVLPAAGDNGEREWRITMDNDYGRRGSLRLAADERVMHLEQHVVIGQGERFDVQFRLVNQKKLDGAATRQAERKLLELTQLRDQLAFAQPQAEVTWTADRVAMLQERLPAILDGLESGPLAEIAAKATKDADRQMHRSGALAALVQRFAGRPAPQPELTHLDGSPLDWKALQGQVTLLHFWSYQDSPLNEPYGQVAYVDFLHRQFAKQGVQVRGVAAHDRFFDPSTRASAVRKAKKFMDFMNLSYPVVYDDGRGLDSFGSPQRTGASLPLYVVLDRNGNVAHYHVGLHAIDLRKGLVELEAVISRILDEKTSPTSGGTDG